MKQRLLVLVAFISFSINCLGQYYSWGTEPTRTTWKQIQTEKFQVIFPKNYDSVARIFLQKLEFIDEYCEKGLNCTTKKTSIILHNQSNISNGIVACCPLQMDLFTIPGQTQNTLEWFNNLAIHEYRHVVQMNKFNQGTTKFLSYLLGEQAFGAISGIYTPKWLFEGDAVCSETALTNFGRGRSADFFKELRAQTYEKGVYSYSKAYFGSYKDNVANEYTLGYVLLSNSKKLYGQQLESDILNRIAKYPFSIRPLNRVIKERTGMNRRDWYKSILEQQSNEWKLQHNREIQTHFDTIIKPSKKYTNYVNGIQINDSTYFVQQFGVDKTSKIIKLINGKKKIIANTAFLPTDERIQSNGKSLVWQETKYNIRWELKQNSYIYWYDTEKKKTKRIRTKQHLFSPAISPSNERIACSEVDETNNYFITIFDKNSKTIIKQIPTPNNDFIIQPSWDETGSKIVFVGLNSKGKRLMEYDVQSNSFLELLPYSNEDITTPLYWKEYVFYISSYSGVDNLYALRNDSKEKYRITVSDFGCRFPSVTDSCLVYSHYTSDGYILAKMKLKPEDWHNISVVKKENFNVAQMMTNMEGGVKSFPINLDTNYTTKRYSKLLHAFNIHSWAPFCLNYNNGSVDDIGFGVQILSQNRLGTTITAIGYTDNFRDEKKAFGKITYRGLYPVFDIEYDLGSTDIKNRSLLLKNQYVTATYRTNELYGRMYLPLIFCSKSFTRQLVPSVEIHYKDYSLSHVSSPKEEQFYRDDIDVAYIGVTLSATNMFAKSQQNLYSRFGQKIFAGYEHSPFNTVNTYSDCAFTEAYVFLPGLVRTHNFHIYGGFEWNKDTVMNFSRQIQTPRGIEEAIPNYKELFTAKINYTFPICYPDLELSDILYIKRIYATIFYDYCKTINSTNLIEYSSYGAEFVANYHFCNIIVPISTGVRIGYQNSGKSMFSELLFSLNFDSL